MEEVISSLFGNTFILVSCLAGVLFGVYNLVIVIYYFNLQLLNNRFYQSTLQRQTQTKKN